MPRELTNIAIKRISLVDRGSHGDPFRIIKRAEAAETAEVLKADLAPTPGEDASDEEVAEWIRDIARSGSALLLAGSTEEELSRIAGFSLPATIKKAPDIEERQSTKDGEAAVAKARAAGAAAARKAGAAKSREDFLVRMAKERARIDSEYEAVRKKALSKLAKSRGAGESNDGWNYDRRSKVMALLDYAEDGDIGASSRDNKIALMPGYKEFAVKTVQRQSQFETEIELAVEKGYIGKVEGDELAGMFRRAAYAEVADFAADFLNVDQMTKADIANYRKAMKSLDDQDGNPFNEDTKRLLPNGKYWVKGHYRLQGGQRTFVEGYWADKDTVAKGAAAEAEPARVSKAVFVQADKGSVPDLAAFEALLERHGLVTVTKAENDAAIRWVFLDDVAATRVGLLVPGIMAGFTVEFPEQTINVLKGETDFSAGLENYGILPMISAGTATLHRVIENLTNHCSHDPAMMSTRVAAAVSEYLAFTLGLVEMLPRPLISLDQEISQMDLYKLALQAPPAAPAVAVAKTEAVAETSTEATTTAAVAEVVTEAVTEVAPAVEVVAEVVKEEAKTEVAPAAPVIDMTAIADLVKQAVSDAVAPVQQGINQLGEKVAGLEGRTASSETLIKSAITGGIPAGDRVRKTADSGASNDANFSFDTATGRKP